MATRIDGTLTGPAAPFVGYRVLALFDQRVDLAPGGSETAVVPTEQGADVERDGSFGIELPGVNRLESPVTLSVRAPDGAVAASRSISVAQLDGKALTLPVPAPAPRSIKSIGGAALVPLRLRGTLFDS